MNSIDENRTEAHAVQSNTGLAHAFICARVKMDDSPW